jgi:selenocysteine-specific elongation factor
VRTRVRFHLGTADVGARVVSGHGAIAPGSRVPVRIILETPIVARAGDRFVVRTPSPATTIGGDIVEDPLPPHRRARGAGIPESAIVLLARLLAEGAGAGVEEAVLPVRMGLSPDAVARVIEGAPEVARRVASRIYAVASVAGLRQVLRDALDRYHEAHPLEPGLSLQSMRGRLTGSAEVIDLVLAEAVAAGEVAIDGGIVRRAGWRPLLTGAEAALQSQLSEAIAAAGREPPAVSELSARFGDRVPALLRLLERAGSVVAVEPERYYDATVIERLIGSLRQGMVPRQEYGPAELRELLGVSRKYLIPLLEYCDRMRVTDRRTTGRVIIGTQFASQGGDQRS